MQDLKQAVNAAFEIADQHHQAGNASMSLVKLALKTAAAHFSPELSAELAGKIGVGATTLQGGRKSFAWNAPLPGKGKGLKKVAAAPRVASERPSEETAKGEVLEEIELGMFEKLAKMKPAIIVETYTTDVLQNFAMLLEVERDENWTPVQFANAIRKAAKSKIGASE